MEFATQKTGGTLVLLSMIPSLVTVDDERHAEVSGPERPGATPACPCPHPSRVYRALPWRELDTGSETTTLWRQSHARLR